MRDVTVIVGSENDKPLLEFHDQYSLTIQR